MNHIWLAPSGYLWLLLERAEGANCWVACLYTRGPGKVSAVVATIRLANSWRYVGEAAKC